MYTTDNYFPYCSMTNKNVSLLCKHDTQKVERFIVLKKNIYLKYLASFLLI